MPSLSLLERLDFYKGLSSQLADSYEHRLVYGKAGRPTAAILTDPAPIIDFTLYWVGCSSLRESQYLAAIINSDTLYEAVKPHMPKGQWGPRDLHKHLWKLPIPPYDATDSLHADLAEAAAHATVHTASVLVERSPSDTTAKVRQKMRSWLAASDTGRLIEELVADLLGQSVPRG